MTELSPEVKAYLSSIGKKGGSSRSEKKRKSSARNGALGGRPFGSKDKKKRVVTHRPHKEPAQGTEN